MYFEINVAKKNSNGGYTHFFTTAERSITTTKHLKIVHNELHKAFPEPEYKLTVSRNVNNAEYVNINTLK